MLDFSTWPPTVIPDTPVSSAAAPIPATAGQQAGGLTQALGGIARFNDPGNAWAQPYFDQFQNAGNYASNLSPELLDAIRKGILTAPNANLSGDSAVSQFVRNGSDNNNIEYHPAGHGPGEDYYVYDPNGNFMRTETGGGLMTNWQGVLSVLGAGLGFGALGAAAGAGAAGGAGLAGDATAAGYGGLSAADAATMGGGASVAGGSALGGSTALGAGAAGAIDLGGGLSMLPDGSIAGASSSIGPLPSNAAIMDSVGAGGVGSSGSTLSNLMNGSGSYGDWLKLASLAGGALAGSQGQQAQSSTSKTMDPRMDSLFYGQLAPYSQGLLASQMPNAISAGNQMLSVGSGLLGQTAPTTATNPYLSSITDDMQRRTQMLLDQNNQSIQGNAVATGGLGGSRQGVAQGIAAGQAADSLQGQIANLYGNAYNQDQNRLLQQQTLGAGLLSQGLNTAWQPIQNTAQTYSPFTGFGTSNTTASQGGGAMGAVGGALGAYGVGKQLGWW